MGLVAHTPAELIRLASAGYWLSQGLSSAARLKLVDCLSHHAVPFDDIVERLRARGGMPVRPRGVLVLLRLLQLVNVAGQTSDGRWYRTVAAPASLPSEVEISQPMWARFAGVTAAVTGSERTDPATYFASLSPDQTSGLLAALDNQSELVPDAIRDELDLGGGRVLLDLGCGSAFISRGLARQTPGLRLVLVDRAEVLGPITAPAVRADGLTERVELLGADLHTMTPPRADVILLSRVLHDWDDASCVALLARVAGALPADGWLVVHEELIVEQAHPHWWPALLDLWLLLETGTGKTRTLAEHAAMLERAGLAVRRCRQVGSFTHLILAQRRG